MVHRYWVYKQSNFGYCSVVPTQWFFASKRLISAESIKSAIFSFVDVSNSFIIVLDNIISQTLWITFGFAYRRLLFSWLS